MAQPRVSDLVNDQIERGKGGLRRERDIYLADKRRAFTHRRKFIAGTPRESAYACVRARVCAHYDSVVNTPRYAVDRNAAAPNVSALRNTSCADFTRKS